MVPPPDVVARTRNRVLTAAEIESPASCPVMSCERAPASDHDWKTYCRRPSVVTCAESMAMVWVELGPSSCEKRRYLIPSTLTWANVSLARTIVGPPNATLKTIPLSGCGDTESNSNPTNAVVSLFLTALGCVSNENRGLTVEPGYGSPASPRLPPDPVALSSCLRLSACTTATPWTDPEFTAFEPDPCAILVESTCQMSRPPRQLAGSPLRWQWMRIMALSACPAEPPCRFSSRKYSPRELVPCTLT